MTKTTQTIVGVLAGAAIAVAIFLIIPPTSRIEINPFRVNGNLLHSQYTGVGFAKLSFKLRINSGIIDMVPYIKTSTTSTDALPGLVTPLSPGLRFTGKSLNPDSFNLEHHTINQYVQLKTLDSIMWLPANRGGYLDFKPVNYIDNPNDPHIAFQITAYTQNRVAINLQGIAPLLLRFNPCPPATPH